MKRKGLFEAIGMIFAGILLLALLVAISIGLVYGFIWVWSWGVTVAGFASLAIPVTWKLAFIIWLFIALVRLIFWRKRQDK
ncbi:hypothetical protein [Citrobacter sp. FP75]|uniref:hypothetical protein n=1 Tax=Citrobacter sp. FP75 TaxID=1852949 RepID=UPI001BC93427|nr:hypothetical protein [Citrobacter sp. FP75]